MLAAPNVSAAAELNPPFRLFRSIPVDPVAVLLPQRIEVAMRQSDMTDVLASCMAYNDYQVDRFLELNDVSSICLGGWATQAAGIWLELRQLPL